METPFAELYLGGWFTGQWGNLKTLISDKITGDVDTIALPQTFFRDPYYLKKTTKHSQFLKGTISQRKMASGLQFSMEHLSKEC